MTNTALAAFNDTDDRTAHELVLACAAVPRWATEVVQGRPYADVDAALAAARTAADPWTEDEVDAALARHPRIGENAAGADADAAHSRREQSGIDAADDDLTTRLREANRSYEERFGHVFLIRAVGRSAVQILTALEERMTNDPATERRVAADQLREIAVLRLQGELS